MRGIEDESAGYHPKRTEWYWSAGVGTATDGRLVGWNLVEGVNDPPARSERASGSSATRTSASRPRSASTASTRVGFESGERLTFTAEAERAANEDNFLVKYCYRQPFGSFSGSLDGIELA